jgi:hypothetical protein
MRHNIKEFPDKRGKKYSYIKVKSQYSPLPLHQRQYLKSTPTSKFKGGKRIGYGRISLIPYLFSYLWSDSDPNTDNVNHVG